MKKQYRLLLALMTIFTVGVVFIYVFSQINFGTKTFRSAIKEFSESQSLYSLSIGAIEGNPLSGFTIHDAELSTRENPVGKVTLIFVRPSLFSLLTKNPTIRSLHFESFFFSADNIIPLSVASKEEKNFSLPSTLHISMEDGVIEKSDLGNIAIEKGRFLLKDGDFDVKARGNINALSVQVEASGKAEESSVLIQNLTAKSQKSRIVLSGRIIPEIILSGNIESLYMADLQKASAALSKEENVIATGQASSSLMIHGQWPDLVVEGNLSIDNANLDGFLLSKTKSLWTWNGTTLSFTDIKGHIFESPVSGSISMTRNQGVHFDLLGENLHTSKWYEVFPWLDFVQGNVEKMHVNLVITGQTEKGSVSFSSPSAIVSSFPLENIHGEVVIHPDNTLSLQTQGEWHKTPVDGQGTISLQEETLLDLSFSTNRLNLKRISEISKTSDSLRLEGDASGMISIKGPASSLSIAGQFRSDRIRFNGSLLNNISLDFEQQGNLTKISSFNALLGKSSISGQGTLSNLFTEEEILIDLKGEGKGLEISSLEESMPSIKTLKAQGPLSLTWAYFGPLSKPQLTFSAETTKATLFENISLENIFLSGQYEKGNLKIEKMEGGALGGLVSLAGDISLEKSVPTMQMVGELRKINLANVSRELSHWPSFEGNISSTFKISGNLATPLLAASLEGEDISVMGVMFKHFSMETESTTEGILIKKAEAALEDSILTAAGNISYENGIMLNINVPPTNIQTLIAPWYPETAVGGTIAGEISISGPFTKPSINAKASMPVVHVGDFSFNDVVFSILPEEKGLLTFSLAGIHKKCPVSLNGTITPDPSGWHILLSTTDDGLPLEKLTANGNNETYFSGALHVSLDSMITKEGMTGEGIITSPEVKLYGFSLSQLSLPFEITQQGLIAIAKGSANAYDSEGEISGSFDPHKFRWESTMNFEGMNLEKASADWLTAPGKVSGIGTLNLKVSGTLGQLKLVFGNGSLYATEGALSGFPLVKKISTSDEIRYRSILANFNVDGKSFYLLPGSRAAAYPDDTIYRYFTASGTVGIGDKSISLKCLGDINLKALNTFLGAIRGLISVGDNITDPLLLQKFLSGLVGGYSVRDFRETSFTLAGTWNDMKMYDLKVSQPIQSTPIPFDSTFSDEKEKEKVDDIKIKLSFPTGEGKDNSLSPGEQVKKQLMENLLKQIIKPGESGDDSTTPSEGDSQDSTTDTQQ